MKKAKRTERREQIERLETDYDTGDGAILHGMPVLQFVLSERYWRSELWEDLPGELKAMNEECRFHCEESILKAYSKKGGLSFSEAIKKLETICEPDKELLREMQSRLLEIHLANPDHLQKKGGRPAFPKKVRKRWHLYYGRLEKEVRGIEKTEAARNIVTFLEALGLTGSLLPSFETVCDELEKSSVLNPEQQKRREAKRQMDRAFPDS